MTRPDINNLDKKVAVIEQKIDDLSCKITSYQDDNKEDHRAVRELITTIDNKKADREVVDTIRNDIRKLVWIIMGAVVASILTLILK